MKNSLEKDKRKRVCWEHMKLELRLFWAFSRDFSSFSSHTPSESDMGMREIETTGSSGAQETRAINKAASHSRKSND